MAIQQAFTLTPNEIYETLANMIISQQVFADNIGKHQTLVDKARVDGGLYGDTKLYYATDCLESHDWLGDLEAGNLLSLDRPADPEVQAIKLDKFRQIRLTTDNYCTKRAFSTEGAFSSFNGVMLGWMSETKKIYDGTLYNVYIGTTTGSTTAQNVTIDIASFTTGISGLDADKKEAMVIAQNMADLFVKMGDYSRDYNDYGYLRSYANEDIKVVWNSDYVNKIRKIDLPTIFNNEGLMDKFEEEVLPARYFGDVTSATVSSASNDGSYRSTVERDYTDSTSATVHVFPGDVIPAGVTEDIAAGEAYVVNPKVIAKVLVKLPPYMSAFEVGTTFFNPRSLTENHYTTFSHNTLSYLKNYPFITVSEA